MRILVLGGTRFAGRAIVEAALGRGDTVTLFNRGITNHGLFPGVETVIGDRTEDLYPLGRREFDAVVAWEAYTDTVETKTYRPTRPARASADTRAVAGW